MEIYAIGDLHLSTTVNKPMTIFGAHWENHWDKIYSDWKSKVKDDDVVLIPGDISWAMDLEDAYYDLFKVSKLPGYKVFCKGNHDFWWKSLKQINGLALDKMFFLQNNSISLGEYTFCGTRGWINPLNPSYSIEKDQKLYERELSRLRLSLESVVTVPHHKIVKPHRIIVLIHFPPFGDRGEMTQFTDLMEEFNVKACVYGHLHNVHNITQGVINGIDYHMVSCDYINFKLKNITSL